MHLRSPTEKILVAVNKAFHDLEQDSQLGRRKRSRQLRLSNIYSFQNRRALRAAAHSKIHSYCFKISVEAALRDQRSAYRF